MPGPVFFLRPCLLATDTEGTHIVLEQVDILHRELRPELRAQAAEHRLRPPAPQGLEDRAQQLGQRMVQALPLAVHEIRDAIIRQRKPQDVRIRVGIAHEHADITPAIPLLTAEAQDIRRHDTDLQARIRRLDDAQAARILLRHLRKTEQGPLDMPESRCTEPGQIPQAQITPLRLDAEPIRQFLKILHRLAAAVEQAAFILILAASGIRIHRERHMHRLHLLQQRREDSLLLRVEEDEAIHPDLRVFEERCLRDTRSERFQHVFGIVGTPGEGLLEVLCQQGDVVELARELGIALPEFLRRFRHQFRCEAIALGLLDGLGKVLAETVLLRRAAEYREVVRACRQDMAQEQAPPDFRDARQHGAARLEQHLPRKTAETEHIAAQESPALRNRRSEPALHLECHVLRQEQDQRRSHRILLHTLPHILQAGMRLPGTAPPQDKFECCCHIALPKKLNCL